MQPTSHYMTCLGREIHYMKWGDESKPALVMWHGLARTSRDFDDLAAALAGSYHIVCPDTIGRGLSQWSPDPDKEYCLAFYADLARAFVDQLGFTRFRWVGTSMGGAIGMVAAATTLKGRVSHLVLNDIGPKIADAAVTRIRSYAGSPPQFDTVTQLEQYFRTVYKPYGWQSDAQWRRMAETSVRRLPDGKVTPHYDPNMVRQFIAHPDDYARWTEYDTLDMPVLVLRGVDSDLLLQDTAEEMTRRGPKARLEVIPGCGHAPCLNVPEQIGLVAGFLA
ncbi:alpha/beta fold hydrolase [Noviherbaspirillum galbum]|uniref:Alpha/beta hydrolase n=1 Tax=Noviherbaspirillum galbum TaxID=2709383 RepID=A0A6B3ST31_9BURK|nr:alpha/beta hydrolase [Noviherbaspirillum galbum]NEX63811.1 alpha/beta hydrolase [Noviherbaspirillum galbum]